MVVFGPIPSRRLGHSLGINHIPPKHCSYSCVYCQVGPTPVPEIERRAFLPVDDVVAEVTARVGQLRERGDGLDFLTFVPDGEPTLDLRLGEIIGRLRPLDVPIAVITNATLLVAVPYRGHHFYMRRFTRPPERGPGPSGWCRRREAP